MNLSSSTSQNMPQSKIKLGLRLGIGAIVLVTAALILLFTPVGSWLKLENLRWLQESMGIFGPLGYILIYIVATVLAVPDAILTFSAGALFGLMLGTLWTVIGATLGATAAFMIARFVAGDWVKDKFQDSRFNQLSDGIEHNGFWFVLSIRLAPIFPFNAVNYLFGLTPIPLPTYVIATAVGIIPATFAYAWLGRSGLEAISGSPPWQLIGALVVLAVLSTTPLLWKKSRLGQ
ncbi:TVP38/TMEM64 family protein [Moorena sp. SIO3H5]|uniref:TVP38/TMEM64 family protein n=1 Tax=Moorena sp. SIO3H5 TaxID=2607834 RepID=UPI0013BD5B39|nr:TVP38/TMEM64 family protein [Moorena sp. SIO3H5]NEO73920.1 TVP38/TMEM64 family protein [Moorena sp. SIO3H5]